eukprot:m.38279 g.38279  ORF g.38279 m.38279 type:complete len:317 (-) comp10201_c0_seq1:119-1069(-)
MATIVEAAEFDPEELAKDLRSAMKGFGTNEKKIIKALCSVNNEQRQVVAKKYKTMYGRDLVKDLKSELGGNMEDVAVAFMFTPIEYTCSSLYKAMDGIGTDEETLCEVLASRTNDEVAAINELYKEKYDKSLEDHIMSETSGNLRRILVSLVQGDRDESEEIDEDKAQADAQALFDAGEGSWGTDESEFNRVFMSSGFPHLRAVFKKYREISDYDINKAIKREMSGDLEFAYLALVQCIRSPPVFFATRIKRSIDGLGTNDSALIRAIVSRCEIDLKDVMESFIDKYDKSLAKAVKDECSGDYERFLLAIIEGNEE